MFIHKFSIRLIIKNNIELGKSINILTFTIKYSYNNKMSFKICLILFVLFT